MLETAMPKRTTLTLPDPVVKDLEKWSKIRGQSFATCGALAVEIAMKKLKEDGEIPSDD